MLLLALAIEPWVAARQRPVPLAAIATLLTALAAVFLVCSARH